jgi:hypothetical protein
MKTERETLVFCVSIALGKGLSLLRGMKKALTPEERRRVAETIVRELETTNWKVSRGQPGRPPG